MRVKLRKKRVSPGLEAWEPSGVSMLLYVYRFYLIATDIYVDALRSDEEEVCGG